MTATTYITLSFGDDEEVRLPEGTPIPRTGETIMLFYQDTSDPTSDNVKFDESQWVINAVETHYTMGRNNQWQTVDVYLRATRMMP